MMSHVGDLLAKREATSTAPDSRIGIMTTGDGNWPEWDRFLTIDGKKAYHIGNICGTCEFVFERLEGAVHKLSPKRLSAQFKIGVEKLDEDLIQTAVGELPAGNYRVLL